MSDNMGSRANSAMKARLKEPKQNGELGKKTPCRICHEDDYARNMEAPCSCSGTLKLAHRKCVQKWCNSKKNTICEICEQPYETGYTVAQEEEANGTNSNENNENWTYARVLRIEDARRLLNEDGVEDNEIPLVTREAIIRFLLFLPGTILMMKFLWDQEDDVDDHGYGEWFLDFVKEYPFFGRLVPFMIPIYLLCWILCVVIERSGRHNGQPYQARFLFSMKPREA